VTVLVLVLVLFRTTGSTPGVQKLENSKVKTQSEDAVMALVKLQVLAGTELTSSSLLVLVRY
jgi:hypothetical protein